MAARDNDTDKKTSPGKKPASPDTAVKRDKTGKSELSDDELKDVSGGSFSWGISQNT